MLGGDEAVLPWLHSVGVTAEESLRPHVPPLPPHALRRIVAADEDEIFLWSGFVDLVGILGLFAQHQRRPDSDGWRVLDFGCGCGRLTRFFVGAPLDWHAYGSEVNADHVAWCRDNLTGVDTRLNTVRPPLPFDTASMDLVYTVSVLSHLPAEPTAQWVAELARVVAPGGILVVSTHGQPALATIASSPQHQRMFRLSPDEALDIARRLPAEGMIHIPYEQDILDMANTGGDYGNSFLSAEHIGSQWAGTDLELVAHLPGGLRGWQDIAVLRRR